MAGRSLLPPDATRWEPISVIIFSGAETVFLTTSAENMYLSSSVVKQIAYFGGDISHFVPESILEDIQQRLIKER